jgi:hypothetical protein
VHTLTLKEGRDRPRKAEIVLRAKGELLDLPALPLTQPLRVQLKNGLGACWEALYSAPAAKNSAEEFRDRAD